MDATFRICYGLAVAILVLLAVILGVRTFYDEPPGSSSARVDYHQDVFMISGVAGATLVAGGVYLYRRLEAIAIGILLGGVGVIIFGWEQASGDLDEGGTELLFVAVALSLALVLGGGYWFLRERVDR